MNISLRKTVLFALSATVLGACVPMLVVAADEVSKDKASEEWKLEMQTKINLLLDKVRSELELLSTLKYLDVEARKYFQGRFEHYLERIKYLERSIVPIKYDEEVFGQLKKDVKDLIEERKARKFLSWAWSKKKSKLLTSGLVLGTMGCVKTPVGFIFGYPAILMEKSFLHSFWLVKAFCLPGWFCFAFHLLGRLCLRKSYYDLRECFTGEETHEFFEGF